MERQDIIARFCQHIRDGLRANEDLMTLGERARRALIDPSPLDEESQHLLAHLVTNFQEAAAPSAFVMEPVTRADALFEQAYELLRVTFARDVLGTREKLIQNYAIPHDLGRSQTSAWLCRCFTVSGSHHYDETGTLRDFTFDPLSATRSIAATLSGNLMDLEGAPGNVMAGIGYVATRPAFRRQKHGQALVHAFEQQMAAFAARDGKTLRLIILEAEARARPFWAGCGYRCPAGSRYLQPPIDFDLETGEKLFDDVPEQLMVKVFNSPDTEHTDPADHIDARLLEAAVQTIYTNWYANGAANPEAARRIHEYIFGNLLNQFKESIRSWGASVPLVLPPGNL